MKSTQPHFHSTARWLSTQLLQLMVQFAKQIQAYTVAVMLANCFPTQAYPLPPQMVGISDLWLRTVLECDLQVILHSKKTIILTIKKQAKRYIHSD